MRIAIVLGFLLVAECAAQGSDVYRYEVKRGSELEKELGYKLSVQDEHDEERSEGMDAVIPIEGSAPDYFVKFRATVAGKLKDLFELDLTLNDANGTLLRVPLAIRSKWNKENEVDVRFPIKKGLINQAVLAIRCVPRMSLHPEASYSIRLGDYAPGNASAGQSPTPRSTLEPGPYQVFKAVEALKQHIAKLPGGGEIYFQRWLGPGGRPGWDNKFISATDELKSFCAEHHITLTLSAVQPYY